jgi:hypothetical protein
MEVQFALPSRDYQFPCGSRRTWYELRLRVSGKAIYSTRTEASICEANTKSLEAIRLNLAD